MHRQILDILTAAIDRADPERAVREHIERAGKALVMAGQAYDLDHYERVVVLAAGKAAAPMCRAVEVHDLLGPRLGPSLAVTQYGYSLPLTRVELMQAGHPVPDQSGLEAATRMLDLAQGCTHKDLALVLLSGGASGLLPAPRQGITLADKQAATGLLLTCGADIQELNAVRKHLSRIKGGGLARALAPATVCTLAVSDVVGDAWDVIGSGPTSADPTTFQDCLDICARHQVLDQMPTPVRELLQAGAAGQEPETVNHGDPCLAKAGRAIIAGNADSLDAAAAKAGELGLTPLALDAPLQGEARDAARGLVQQARDALSNNAPLPACILAGGETTVTVRGPGQGGRNQELALALVLELGKDPELGPRVHAACCGTDGRDGPTDAAGACIYPDTLDRARQVGLDASAFLAANDSHSFFRALNDLIVTGPTRTNVMDLAVLLVT